MTESASSLDSTQSLAGDLLARLEQQARAAASWDIVLRPQGVGPFRARVVGARQNLKQLQRDLGTLPAKMPDDGTAEQKERLSALYELRSNPRQLRSAIDAVFDRPRDAALLPRIVVSENNDEPRVATISALYLQAVDGEFSALSFTAFVQALQTHEPLTVDELWNTTAFLKFALLESVLVEARALYDSTSASAAPGIMVRMASLRAVGQADWTVVIEPLILFDATLRQDPSGDYANMDFESRETYRSRVAFVARHSDFNETKIAQLAIDLAREAADSPDQPSDFRVQRRRMHVGYYLIEDGFPALAERAQFHPRVIDRCRKFMQDHADDFYITGIQVITLLFIAVALFPPLQFYTLASAVLAFLLMFMPAMQCAVDLVNNAVTAIFDPAPLPKLDFSKQIPENCTTLVAVPTLLLNEKQVRELVTSLEVRYLANRDPQLHFALLTDMADSVSQPRENDFHPLVDLAVKLINDLNTRYASPKGGSFILLHRRRIFNVRQGVWMGWERKRGKLLDLNKLLIRESDAFPVKAGNLAALEHIRYILTLDSDTQLPRGTAAQLIGVISHPLHQAIIDANRRVVVKGYGILQPRVGVTVRSASRSRLANIYSGQTGFDIYTRAVSDAYQDLYGEGSFTGKGIYEVATLHAVLDRRFPRNSLLSHDLIEGAYARAGLATDIEIIDDYPSHYSAYARRKHRWVRGDWQIAQWMFSRVPDESGHRVPSPISSISRWKIFDNLRRSLVEPFTFILFVAGWLGLPGGPLYWTIVPLLLIIFPTLVGLAFSLSRALLSHQKGSVGKAFYGFYQSSLLALLSLVFLPHQTLLAIDAIVRALVRRFITGNRLLEWETAAQAESQTGSRTPVDLYLALMPLVAGAVAIVVYLHAPHSQAIWVAAPILLLWGFASVVTAWLNQSPPEQRLRLSLADKEFLFTHALRIWRYFHQFGAANHHHLIPDNVEEKDLREAARVSPTNLGLVLNARQAACEFGFITAPEFTALTLKSLETLARLPKYQGHLYNWYDTQTLAALDAAPFVSSVDSGNFVASLYTLHTGAQEMLRQPIVSCELFTGLIAHWQLMKQDGMPAALQSLIVPRQNALASEWMSWLPTAEQAFRSVPLEADAWWSNETRNRIDALLTLLRNYVPWMLPELEGLKDSSQAAFSSDVTKITILDAAEFADQLDSGPLHEKLVQVLPDAKRNLRALIDDLHSIAFESERLAEEANFSVLVDPGRRILSIGYDMGAQKLHTACYDMLASEARIATFLAIARGDLPQQSWFKLGRDFAHAFDRFLLLSWTGTMFEYLMPSLWMRSYPETLISRTLVACVQVQRAFTRSLNIPWGISESGSANQDEAGHYQYKAYGVPELALFSDADAGPVIAPYATFLALGVDSVEAIRNLRRMADAGWVGAYGFYESVDYTASLRNGIIVREWMAHHQGMALLAILNCLHDNVVQDWFHANPLLQATELLLHEMPISDAVIKPRLQELAIARRSSGRSA